MTRDKLLKLFAESANKKETELDFSLAFDINGDRIEELPEEIVHLTYLKKLVIGGNLITNFALVNFQDALCSLTDLVHLDLSFNNIINIPSNISNLKMLKHLDLSKNKITILPDEIGDLENLEKLFLEGNQISEIPASIGKMRRLSCLILGNWFGGGNNLLTLPSEIGQLSELRRLIIEENQITNLPSDIGFLSNLKELDLTDNNLTELPDTIGGLNKLEYLDLESNKFMKVPLAITYLKNLKVLNMCKNNISEIPSEISQLSNLKKLSIYWNNLREIPDEIGRLNQLKILDIKCNNITTLSWNVLSRLQELEELDIHGNKIVLIQPEIGLLSKIKKLDISNNNIEVVPNEIGNLKIIEELDIAKNKISNLPISLCKMQKLKKIDISENKIRNIPDEYTLMQNIEVFRGSNNYITEFPKVLTTIHNIKDIIFDSNNISEIPEEIGNLRSLDRLSLNSNNIIDIPPQLGLLKELRYLYLNSNDIKQIPPEIGLLTKLQSLDLKDNKLTKLPIEICQLEESMYLHVDNNPLEDPPLEIAEKGIPAIREYFRQKEEAGSETLYEAKLLIVGEGQAGKTTLVRKLKNPDCDTRAENTTEGIDISRWEFPMENGNTFRVNVWDFGGQEIYHNTHQFFLTSRSLYALVADSRREATNFKYWLQTVNALSDGSPTVIVKNRTDGRVFDIGENNLKHEFDCLQSVHDVYLISEENNEKEKICNLVTDLQEQLQALPLVGMSLPKTWVKVRNRLENHPSNYLQEKDYINICIECGMKLVEDMEQLLGYLHDLGVVLHFKDDPLLHQVLFLRPEWVTDTVYKVLDNKKVGKQLGRFGKKDLATIWRDDVYKGQHTKLVQLMKVFGLCYSLPGVSDTWIAPQLLSKDRPDYEWPNENCLALQYSYDFMPSGLVVKLIMALHTLLESQEHTWKYGAIFQKNGARAEVLELTDQKEIRVRVNGQLKRELLTVVTYELERIHSTFPGLNMSKRIPCPCSQCKDSETPHYFDEDYLKRRLEAGKQTVECDNSIEAISITYLLNEYLDADQLEKLQRVVKNVYVEGGGIYVEGDNNVVGNDNVINRQESGSGDAIVKGRRE